MSQTHEKSDHESTTGTPPSTPRWVKMLGIILIVLVLLFIGVMLFGGGTHGPGRHMSSSGTGGYRPPRVYEAQQL